jgi:hypothetical protein
MVLDVALRLSAEADRVRMHSSEKIGPPVKRVPLGGRKDRIPVPPARIDVPGGAKDDPKVTQR